MWWEGLRPFTRNQIGPDLTTYSRSTSQFHGDIEFKRSTHILITRVCEPGMETGAFHFMLQPPFLNAHRMVTHINDHMQSAKAKCLTGIPSYSRLHVLVESQRPHQDGPN